MGIDQVRRYCMEKIFWSGGAGIVSRSLMALPASSCRCAFLVREQVLVVQHPETSCS